MKVSGTMVSLLETTNAVDRMKKLILMISDAAEAYYVDDEPICSDKSYDALCDELESLEQSTGIILANSPLHKVMGRVADGFVKVKHTEPMLSAAKTKDIGDIQKWQRKHGDRVVCASWKEDGATCVLRYKEGNLVQVTPVTLLAWHSTHSAVRPVTARSISPGSMRPSRSGGSTLTRI